ncbi:MAG: hypothetical protein IIY77_08005 [Lachnospiraceae bacterium]|nr:hypothetical protein [Lachnospiraceae bacterium]
MKGSIYHSRKLRLDQLGDFWPAHFHPGELTAGLYKRALCFYFPEVYYAFDVEELLEGAELQVLEDPADLIILEISTRDPKRDEERLSYLYYEFSEVLRQLYYEDEEKEIEKYTLRVRLVGMEDEKTEAEPQFSESGSASPDPAAETTGKSLDAGDSGRGSDVGDSGKGLSEGKKYNEFERTVFRNLRKIEKWKEAEKCLKDEWPLIIRDVKENSGDPDLAFRASLSGLKLNAVDAEGDRVKVYITPWKIQWQEVLMELEGTEPDRYLEEKFRDVFARCIGDFFRKRRIADVKNPEIIFDYKPEELPFM